MLSKTLKYGFAAFSLAISLSACGLINTEDSANKNNLFNFGSKSGWESDLAVISYTQGHFDEADEHVLEALHNNKKDAQALLVGALLSEKTDRPNRARQYYEEILLYNGNEVSVLGSDTPKPEKITDIARKRLRQLNLKQNKLIIEDKQGNKVFNISNEASAQNSTQAMQSSLAKKSSTNTNGAAISSLFNNDEKNIIARFIIIKDLAENDMITKEEFLRARQANIGGLLPLTHAPASAQIIKPVPGARIIIDRINALKSALEDRAITSKEFTAERNLIIEAILPPYPTQRLNRKAPSREIITAAKDLRKLEVIYDLNLITSDEKAKEKAAIEQALGLGNKDTQPQTTAIETTPTVTVTTTATTVPVPVTITAAQPAIISPQQPQAQAIINTTEESISPAAEEITAVSTIPASKATSEAQPLIPAVSSPFIDK